MKKNPTRYNNVSNTLLYLVGFFFMNCPNGLVRSGCPTKMLRAFLPKKVFLLN